MPNTVAEWEALDEVNEIMSGDVLILHVWSKIEGARQNKTSVEAIIGFANKFQLGAANGSRSAEHVAMVGAVNGVPRIFEADLDGIKVRTECTTRNFNKYAYTLYRLPQTYREDFAMLCDGMATRLAKVQCEVAVKACKTVSMEGRGYSSIIKTAVKKAHRKPALKQSTSYDYATVIRSVVPTIFPESWYLEHDKKLLNFIGGSLIHMTFICSGFAATMLQTFSIQRFEKRLFTDPKAAHPTTVEHVLISDNGRNFGDIQRMGRWGSRT